MTMKNSVFSLFFILCILPGCQRAKEDIVLLDLTQMLTEKLYQNQDMPSLELVSELQLDNDVLLGGFPHLFYCSRDLYGISDRNHLYFFRRSDGKLYSDLTHIGRGPSEYLYPMHVSVRDTVVCISDKPEIGKAIFYSTSGKYLRTDKIPVNSIYEFLDENHYALLYDNREDKSFEVYFNNGTLVRECSIDNGPKNTSNTYVAVFQESTLPPCVLITCEKDILKNNSIAFYNALKRNGIQCELHPYSDPELVHDFPLFQCDLPEAGFAIDRINDFFCLCRK